VGAHARSPAGDGGVFGGNGGAVWKGREIIARWTWHVYKLRKESGSVSDKSNGRWKGFLWCGVSKLRVFAIGRLPVISIVQYRYHIVISYHIIS